MATLFFPLLESHNTGGREDVVFRVHWECAGSGQRVYGTHDIAYDPEAGFIAFADLTPAIVKAWLPVVFVAEQEAELTRLAALPEVEAGVPWN